MKPTFGEWFGGRLAAHPDYELIKALAETPLPAWTTPATVLVILVMWTVSEILDHLFQRSDTILTGLTTACAGLGFVIVVAIWHYRHLHPHK
jgi:hypothetical protein